MVVVLWAMPAASAMALSLHVALGHHHHHGDTSHHAAGDLLAAVHGHQHRDIVPDHEHSAISPEAPTGSTAVWGNAPMGALQRPTARNADTVRWVDSRAGPPDRLFYDHCPLRL